MTQLWVYPEELDAESSVSPYAYEACKAATHILWGFSGRKYHGTRSVTERYECPCQSGDGISLNVYPRLDGSGNVENRLGARGSACGCQGVVAGRHTRLRLRGTPVRSVSRVAKGGVVIDPSSYKVVNGSLLQLNGSEDVCGLEVTYTYGVSVPASGRLAARALAQQMVYAYEGAEECDLPDRVTSVTRQGISFTLIDPQDFLDDGRTGIYLVDLFLRVVNPDKARKPARVFSPDLPKAYRITGRTPAVISDVDWTITRGTADTWEFDLAKNGAEIFEQSYWEALGQITNSQGVVISEFSADRFTVENGVLSIQLDIAETTALNSGLYTWDVYAFNTFDEATIIHVHDTKIHVS